MSERIVFVDELPEPANRAVVDHVEVAAALKKRPGEWAQVGRYASAGSAGSIAQSVRTGKIKAYATGVWEARSRTVEGAPWLFVRYVGPSDGAE